MVTKKIILDYKQQPIDGNRVDYVIYINGSLLTYAISIHNYFIYKNGANNPDIYIGIGADLDDTLDKTLSFLNTYKYFDGFVGGYATNLSYARVGNTIEVSINSEAPLSNITVWRTKSTANYIFIQPETPCTQIYLSNNTSSNANTIFGLAYGSYNIRNVQLNTNKAVTIPNRFDCVFDKGYSYAIEQGGTPLLFFSVTASPNETNFVFTVTNNNLTIDLVGSNAIVEYSIDGVTYQSENVFNGISSGVTVLYVKDVYNCIKTYNIVNNGATNGNVTTPYTYISESNSLRFINRVEHQNCGNYKNVFNTLSCEENVSIANKYLQLFQSCDTIKTQLKTSYENVEVYIKDSADSFTEITANKIVNNIGLTDKRDCTYYSYNGKLACYFLSGNTYDYDTTDVNGTYVLNGELPPFGVIGTWVETEDYGILQVSDIILDDNGYRSLVFNLNITLSSVNQSTIQCLYNKESYDIWEFDVDMSVFVDKMFTIGVRFYQTVEDVNFPDVYWLSEKIQVKARHQRSLEIVWGNSKNTDIYFYSGIRMKNRLNFAFINTQLSDGDIEIQKTDSQVIPIDATNYNAVQFSVLALTTGMVRKIKLALKHDYLTIEGVTYVLAESIDTERQGESNFYKLTAKLFEAGDVWNQGTANTQTISSNVELIGLLQGDANSEYIRIQ